MLVEVEAARKHYGEGATLVRALDGVSLSIDSGELLVLLGQSGSGKSTLMNMLGGLDRIDSGLITVASDRISDYGARQLLEYRRRHVGFVFQFYNLVSDLTAWENVQVAADISGNPFRIEELFDALGIADLSRRFPKELSGGQQQRVAIARAIVKRPTLLLCDELTGALDSKSAQVVLDLVKRINEDFGVTTVIVTHNEGIALMADRVVTLHDGKVTSNSIRQSPTKTDDPLAEENL